MVIVSGFPYKASQSVPILIELPRGSMIGKGLYWNKPTKNSDLLGSTLNDFKYTNVRIIERHLFGKYRKIYSEVVLHVLINFTRCSRNYHR